MGGTSGVDVVDFFQWSIIGLEINIERKTLVFGVVLVGIEVAEEPGSSIEFDCFGAAGAEELEDRVGGYLPVSVEAGVEAYGRLVSSVNTSLALGD